MFSLKLHSLPPCLQIVVGFPAVYRHIRFSVQLDRVQVHDKLAENLIISYSKNKKLFRYICLENLNIQSVSSNDNGSDVSALLMIPCVFKNNLNPLKMQLKKLNVILFVIVI